MLIMAQDSKLRRITGGRFFSRPCPDDFASVMVEIGRFGCADHYGVRRATINRWLEECGKDELIERRAVLVHARAHARWTKRLAEKIKPAPVAIDPGTPVNPALAMLAAQHLRRPPGGGWVVFSTGKNRWCVGLMRLNASAMLAMSVKRGFDAEGAKIALAVQRSVADLQGEGGSKVRSRP
jgi:hypothetical protein